MSCNNNITTRKIADVFSNPHLMLDKLEPGGIKWLTILLLTGWTKTKGDKIGEK